MWKLPARQEFSFDPLEAVGVSPICKKQQEIKVFHIHAEKYNKTEHETIQPQSKAPIEFPSDLNSQSDLSPATLHKNLLKVLETSAKASEQDEE